MSSKTISIDADAYNILNNARESPRMSFSDAIRRIRDMPRIRTFADMVRFENELFGPVRLKKTHRRAKRTVPAG